MLVEGLKYGDNGMVMPGIGHECLLLPVLITAAPNIGARIFFPTDSVIDQALIRSVEVYDHDTFTALFGTTQQNVIDPADIPKFTYSLMVDDSISIIDKMPLQTINFENLAGKKLSMCISKITTAQSFVQRWDSAALVTATPFIIPFMFYYRAGKSSKY